MLCQNESGLHFRADAAKELRITSAIPTLHEAAAVAEQIESAEDYRG
jgi:hypothetical protein